LFLTIYAIAKTKHLSQFQANEIWHSVTQLVPITLFGKNMKLFSINIPEVAHLDAAAREALLKRCVESERMRRYRMIAPKVVGIALVVCIAPAIWLGWKPLAAAAIVAPTLLLLMYLKVRGEVRIVRAEAKKLVESER